MLFLCFVALSLAAVAPSLGLVGGYQPFTDFADSSFQTVLQTVYRLHPEVKDWVPTTAQRQLVNGFNYIFSLQSTAGSQADVRAYTTFRGEVRLNSFVITSAGASLIKNPNIKTNNVTVSTVTANTSNTTNTTQTTPNTTNTTVTPTTTNSTTPKTTNTSTTTPTPTNATATPPTTTYRKGFDLFSDKKNGSYLAAISIANSENPDLKGFNLAKAELLITTFYYFRLTFQNKLDPTYQIVTTQCLAFEKEPTNATAPVLGGYQQLDLTATADYDSVLKQVLAYEPSLENLNLTSVRRQVVAGYNYLFFFEDRVRLENFTIRASVDLSQNVTIDILLIDNALGYTQEVVDAVVARSNEKWSALGDYSLVMVSNIWEKGSGLRLNFQKGNSYADVYFYLDGTDERFIIYYH